MTRDEMIDLIVEGDVYQWSNGYLLDDLRSILKEGFVGYNKSTDENLTTSISAFTDAFIKILRQEIQENEDFRKECEELEREEKQKKLDLSKKMF